MNLLTLIPLTSSTQPQPAAQGGAHSSSSGSATADNSPATDSNASTGGVFSTLLAPTRSNSAPRNPPATTAQGNQTVNSQTDNTTSEESSDGNNQPTDDATNQSAILMALFMQLQQLAPQPVKLAEGNIVSADMQSASASGNTQPSSPDDLLAKLADLLQQALQSLASSAAPAQTNANTQGTQTDVTTNETGATGDNGKTPDVTDVLALILSLLPQVGGNPQLPATQNTPVSATGQDAMSVSADSSAPANAPLQQLANALNQLADILENGNPSASTDADSSFAREMDAAPSPLPPALIKTDKTQQQTLPQPEVQANQTQPSSAQTSTAPRPIEALEQAVARITEALADRSASPKERTRNDISDTPTIAQPSLNTQPITHTDFVKPAGLPTSNMQQPVIDQIMIQVKNAASDGSSQVRIQLHPEELGKVDVQISTSAEGKTSVTITSDNRTTLALLQNDAQALQDALRDIGLKTDAGGLNFNLRDSGQDARNSSKQQQGGYTQVAAIDDDSDDFGFSTTGSLYRLSVQQGLDIRV